MISSITSSRNQQQPQALNVTDLDVKWTDNVKLVSFTVHKQILKQFQAEQRDRPATLKPTRRDAKLLTDVALQVLQLFSTGKCTGAVAEACGVDRMEIVRFRKWMALDHRLNVAEVRNLADPTLDGIRQFVAGAKGGAA